MIGLATNTMHIVADAITGAIDVPFIHIADPTSDALLADGFETVGLLGTRFTMEMGFYRDRLAARGLTALIPEVDRTNLNGIIYEELCRGIVREESRRIYVTAIERLAARGAEAVILGCTEITMLIDDAVSPLPVYDTTDLHAKALVERGSGLGRAAATLRRLGVVQREHSDDAVELAGLRLGLLDGGIGLFHQRRIVLGHLVDAGGRRY